MERPCLAVRLVNEWSPADLRYDSSGLSSHQHCRNKMKNNTVLPPAAIESRQENLVPARLIKRYKRFLADVELLSGKTITVHCPNPGSMLGLAEAGTNIYLRDCSGQGRKLDYTWVLVELESTFVCVDTLMANKLVNDALIAQHIPSLSGYKTIQREYCAGTSRFDFYLSGHDSEQPCLVEVKSTTLAFENIAAFPDACTERGRKHLNELASLKQNGLRSVQFYCIQRTDVTGFRAAHEIDPRYAESLRVAAGSGVEILAYVVAITKDENNLFSFKVTHSLPVISG